MDDKKIKLDAKLWKKLLAILMRQKKTLIKCFSLITFTALLDVLFPLINAYAIDTLSLDSSSRSDFIIFIIISFVIVLLFGLSVYFYIHFTGIIEAEFAYDLREMAFNKVQSLSFSYFDKNSEGWIISRLTSDITRITEILSWGVIDAVYGLTMILFISIVMLLVNVKLALTILIIVPFLISISMYFQKKILKYQRKVRADNSEVTAAFAENINGAKTIKSLNIEEKIKDDFIITTNKMRRSSLRANLYSAMFIPFVILLSGISSSLLLYYGGSDVITFVIPFGTLVIFTSYINSFFQPLREVARLISEFQMAQASAERVIQLLVAENDVVDSDEVIEKYGTLLDPKVEKYPKLKGDVEYRNVEFYYNENEPVLKDFNLKVPAQTTVALVGETGSGKSTLINLICRFYEPVSGKILIDGINYQELSLGALRANIGYVLQAPHLFSGSIIDNIRYGKLDASDEEVIAAAKRVNAHDFIMSFTDGYNSDVGEGGSRLSTGQKQLISFARAIIKDPSIYILDEATASIDTETELIVQEAISDLLKDKTSFIVAHRLSTIVNSDLILVIKNGEIVESGKHQELLDEKGYYYRLYTNQFKSKIT